MRSYAKEADCEHNENAGPSDAVKPSPAHSNQSTGAPARSAADQRTEPPSRRRPCAGSCSPCSVAGLAGAAWYIFVRQGEEETYLDLQGNIDVRQVNLSFKVDGRVETLAVDEGDTVKAGQVVGTLDKRYFEDELRVARALRDNLAATLAKLEHGSRPEEIAEARAQTAAKLATMVRAKGDDARYQELDKSPGAASKQDVAKYAAQLGVAEADAKYAHESQRLAEIGPRQEDIDAARALLAQEAASIIQLERKLADSHLVAPNDGFILTRSREIGAIVQAGETVFTLTLILPGTGAHYVNERDLGLVRPGMPASVTNDTAPTGLTPPRSASSPQRPNSPPRRSRRARSGRTSSTGCASSWTTPTAA